MYFYFDGIGLGVLPPFSSPNVPTLHIKIRVENRNRRWLKKRGVSGRHTQSLEEIWTV